MSWFDLLFVLLIAYGAITAIIWRINTMSEALDRLTREVQESNDAVQSAATLIAGLAQEIRDNIDDEDALNALADDLDAQQDVLAQAVSDNTAPTMTPQSDG